MSRQFAPGFETACKLKDYIAQGDFSDFAKTYYQRAKWDKGIRTSFPQFLELLAAANVQPFVDIQSEISAITRSSLDSLLTGPVSPWIFEEASAGSRLTELLHQIGIETWEYLPAGRRMHIIPAKKDFQGCLEEIKALEEAGMVSGTLASSNSKDWRKLV